MYLEVLENRALLAGVTILTHGNAGNITGWIRSAADAIQKRLGGTDAASEYVMTVDGSGVKSLKLEDGNKPLDETTKGEAIIKLDWSAISDTGHFTDGVASDVADYLLTSHSGVPDFTQLPFQLIGHSRGASLMSALSGDLGNRGIWVDQVTNLDPHPIPQIKIPFIGTFGDAKMRTYENVIFSDTYYRTGGNDIIDPHGEAVDGSINFNLKNSVQKDHDFSAHMGVTGYYHGTIDLKAITNRDSIIHSSWYNQSSPDKPARDKTGYIYSRIGGAPRPLDGVSTAFGGAADRSGLKYKGAQWANITNVRVVGTTTIGLDQPITVKGIYNDRDTNANVTFFLDSDSNPYNSSTQLTLGTMSVKKTADPHGATMAASASGISTGTYFIGAKITDADGHVRYSYGGNAISVEKADFAKLKNGVVTVTGTDHADRIVVSQLGLGPAAILHINRNGLEQVIRLAAKRVEISAGDGDDTVIGDTGAPAMYVLGGAGNDLLEGGIQNDTLTGGAGKNKLYGNDGDDRLNGSAGRDLLFGGNGSDRLYGKAGNDLLDGGGGVDRLFGGDGDDMLIGGASNDHLFGDAGRDTLIGGTGADTETGGTQVDTGEQDGTDVLTSIEEKMTG